MAVNKFDCGSANVESMVLIFTVDISSVGKRKRTSDMDSESGSDWEQDKKENSGDREAPQPASPDSNTPEDITSPMQEEEADETSTAHETQVIPFFYYNSKNSVENVSIKYRNLLSQNI